ncbi:MAG: D-sedoheptulose 7-phosphate isomerase [Muribaculaceae bacterium]|nr:D-sedoheptulose 7-phosphate isomerase [Muribaculaceae bacterium]MDE6294875.1 D-sedoheptulose 7-phosphate isomerase [Muribaculaceae bacterium]
MTNLEIIKSQIAESAATKERILADDSLMEAIRKAAEVCVTAYRNGKKTLFAGNGGSAADAQHLAGEFVSKFYFDRPGLPSIALTTDTSILTAIGNDYGFNRLFARQVQAQGNEGDVFIGISTSGNSQNIVEALEECRRKGIFTIALTGARPCKMDDFDLVIKVPSESTPRIQECQTMIGHIICCIVEQEIFGQYNPQK